MKTEEVHYHDVADTACGVQHADCINTVNGTCNKPEPHPGESHRCSSCGMLF